ncbi:PAS-domain containing protein [Polymorphum gilvum]|uniref:histidine kinase n=1 Tax=Polymorphum gilvum (strain LMG 25793 / CGMCC 1.9160 / SL003B-26A1) TaxID=991905 RepID=F2IWG1_POLGS|nr:PAS-domain containing protein [Polymorphum gilvum]ADZ69260.1 PAS protein [Polymorphum gilvum SL003B-26A1]
MTRSDPQSELLDLLQAALDHVNQGFSVFDADLRLVAWNRGLWEMLDFPQALAKRGTHLADFLRVNAERGEYGPGDTEAKIARRVERARLFQPHYFERIRPNGQVIAVSGRPLPQGGFVTTYTDVTEERRRQEKLERTVEERTRALRQSEDWLRLVTDNVPALIAYMGPGPVFRFANRRYADWFGHSIASIVGRSPQDVVGQELYAELEPHIEHAFAGNAVSYEYSRRKADGDVAYMRSTLIPDMTIDGRTLGVFVLSLDATEQKRSEATLVQSQRMDAVGKLTGGLAHDFNNLLAILMGNLLSLKRKGQDVTVQEVLAHLEPMLQAAQRGTDLTQRLLAFSRGKATETHDVPLQGVLNNVATLLKGSMPGNVALEIRSSTDRLIARLDPTQIENAIVNLVFNARDALPDGGKITITLDETDLPVKEAAKAGLGPGLYARLTVRDTGIGMSEDTRLRVFEPFFTTKQFGTGSGLGLSMVYGFARQSGGSVDIETVPGEGTAVTLLLPARRRPDTIRAAGPWPDDLPPLPEGNGELILLVEDDAAVAATITEQLQDLGYTVLAAESAEDARSLARDVPEIRALLTDIVMPGQVNGLALARAISTERASLGIALMTGYADWSGLGADGSEPPFPVLAKPFDSRTLAETLRTILTT